MWAGDGTDDDPDESRRKSIEMALAQHTAGIQAPYHPDDDDDDDEDSDEESDDDAGTAGASGVARGKPEAMAARLASAVRLQEKMDELEAEKGDDEDDVVAEPVDEEDDDPLDATMETVDTVATIDTTMMMTKKEKNRSTSAPKKKSSKKMPSTPKDRITSSPHDSPHPTMDDPTTPITSEEYENLEQLMVQFCRVPLLAEFSRPVALLHPEVRTF